MMDRLLKDCRIAIRQFRLRPGFALAVVSTLSLAIGANIAVFSDDVPTTRTSFGVPAWRSAQIVKGVGRVA